MSSCSCQSETSRILVYSCAGAANVGQLADLSARDLAGRGVGRHCCLAGLGADTTDMVDAARRADINLIIDGCPVDCGLRTFERLAIDNVQQIRVTDLGIRKAAGPADASLTEVVLLAALNSLSKCEAAEMHSSTGDTTVKQIKILGTGCPKCEALTQNTQMAADQLGIQYDLEKVKDINKITEFGVMATPALVVDGKVVAAGKLLDVEKIKGLLQS